MSHMSISTMNPFSTITSSGKPRAKTSGRSFVRPNWFYTFEFTLHRRVSNYVYIETHLCVQVCYPFCARDNQQTDATNPLSRLHYLHTASGFHHAHAHKHIHTCTIITRLSILNLYMFVCIEFICEAKHVLIY